MSRGGAWYAHVRDALRAVAPEAFSRIFPRFAPREASHGAGEEGLWYESWETIDTRVSKLRAFELVTRDETAITFHPDYALHDRELFIRLTASYMKKFVNDIERAFPGHDHIIMTGGKDSQLIHLVPKLNPDRWHLFSAEPNYPLVREWITRNGLRINRLFRHDNENDESLEDLKWKIYCGDLYTNPRHVRYLPALRDITLGFNHRCIFWAGTSGGSINRYYGDYHAFPREHYFDRHMKKAAVWQGNCHQIVKNFTGCPLLSPYNAEEIWDEFYMHLDPAIITEGTDLRMQIGEKLAGRPIWWLEHNPTPTPYRYGYRIEVHKVYIAQIKKSLRKKRKERMAGDSAFATEAGGTACAGRE
jgi:hypothetical protein